MAQESVAELEAKLKQAKEQEAKINVEAFWEQIRMTFHDRCFVTRRFESGFNYIHYLLQTPKDRNPELRTRVIAVFGDKRSKWGISDSTPTLVRNRLFGLMDRATTRI